MKITVIYPSDGSYEKSRLQFEVEVGLFDPAIDTNDIDRVLGLAWRATNIVIEDDVERMKGYAKQCGVAGIRPSMVGDVFIVPLTVAGYCFYGIFVVDLVGFKQIEPQSLENWLNLSANDRIMRERWELNTIDRLKFFK